MKRRARDAGAALRQALSDIFGGEGGRVLFIDRGGEVVLRIGAARDGERVLGAVRVKLDDEREPGEIATLTTREREILDLIARGWPNRRIASALGISERTVKTHVSNMLAKLGLADRTQAAIFAFQRGIA